MKSLLPLAILALTACTNPFASACTTFVASGLVVIVHDSLTGAPIAAGAVGIATDGAYRDSLRLAGLASDGTPESLAGADERPGTYIVQVSRPGYFAWSDSGVSVIGGRCHVQTVTLTAEMTPSP